MNQLRQEHPVNALELFFDLVIVFAFIQVTTSIVEDPTWSGVLRAMLVLAALWWAWCVYSWLTSASNLDEGWVRLTTLAAMGAMFFVALAVPGAFGEQAVMFGIGYLVVRLLHIVLSAIVARRDDDRRSALLRFLPTSVLGPLLILLAAFLNEDLRVSIWVVALAIDYLGPLVVGMGRGWHVEAEHFAERYRLIILIALGESIIAIGFGAGADLHAGVLVAVALAVLLVSALWWLYFDVAAIFSRDELLRSGGIERARLARDSYSYLHLPVVAGIVLFAFGLESCLHHVDTALGLVPAVALCGGTALYLLGHIAFLFRATRRVFRRRLLGAMILLALTPVVAIMPTLTALALVGVVCWAVVAYEAIRHREARARLRRGERA